MFQLSALYQFATTTHTYQMPSRSAFQEKELHAFIKNELVHTQMSSSTSIQHIIPPAE